MTPKSKMAIESSSSSYYKGKARKPVMKPKSKMAIEDKAKKHAMKTKSSSPKNDAKVAKESSPSHHHLIDLYDETKEDLKKESLPWPDEPSLPEIIRLQSRDGFWDLSSAFVKNKTGGELPEISQIDLSMDPIVKKRVISTVFTLTFLAKFMTEKAGSWKFAKEKGLKWLRKIDSSVNWQKIIDDLMPSISK